MNNTRLVCALAVVGLAACGDFAGSPMAGATPGGSQDIGYARRIIDNGGVPRAEDFTVEGLLSEHDLPLGSETCSERLCIQAAAGLARSFETGGREAFVQLGFSSNVDLSQFKRRPQNLGLVVDVSGSMSNGSLDAVKTALHRLVTRLDASDLVTLVAFDDSSDIVLEGVRGSDHARLDDAIDDLETRGGTCIECGLRDGYAALNRRHAAERDSRVMLFTDAMPNVGATGDGEFIELVRAQSERVGLTAFGVGIDFGHTLALAISRVRGGNYFYLESTEKIAKVFDEEFDTLVTPLAYDLKLEIAPGAGFEVAAVHGIPGWEKGDAKAVIDVPTVFLSKRRGAILVRLTGEAAPQVAIVNAVLGYSETNGVPHDATLNVIYDGAEPLADGVAWYSAPGVRKTVALTNLVLGLQKACTLWHKGEKAEARRTAEEARDWLKTERATLADAALDTEIELAQKLVDAMTVP